MNLHLYETGFFRRERKTRKLRCGDTITYHYDDGDSETYMIVKSCTDLDHPSSCSLCSCLEAKRKERIMPCPRFCRKNHHLILLNDILEDL